MTGMRFGVDIAQQRMEWDDLLGRVRLCEDLGFDGMWGFDHFVPMYGEGPGNCFEGMTTLAALASATSRIRLGLLVTGVTYRHPSVLAAEAVTVDHASHGRLELAMGAAWYEAEHHQLGIDFPPLAERFDRLEDGLEILSRLFTGKSSTTRAASSAWPTRSYDRPRSSSRTRRSGSAGPATAHPPAGCPVRGRLALLRVAAELPRAVRAVDELATTAGRDPASITRASSLSLSEPWARGACERRGDAGGRVRVPRLRVARQGARQGRGVRRAQVLPDLTG